MEALLQAAAAGENLEWTKLYPDFADVAKKEGFDEVYQTFTNVAKVEKFHEARYLELVKNVRGANVFKKDASVKWHCRNCGYVFDGKEVPDRCPVCKHPRAYFEILPENY